MVIYRTVQFTEPINKHENALQMWIFNIAIQKQMPNNESPFLIWVTREVHVMEA